MNGDEIKINLTRHEAGTKINIDKSEVYKALLE